MGWPVNPTNFTAVLAAADEMVDRYVKYMREQPMTTNDLATVLLGQEQDNLKLVLAFLAATAIQRLAQEGSS